MPLEPITLSTTRIRLEPLSLVHLDDLVARGSDPAIYRWSPAPDGTADGMRCYIDDAIAEREAGVSLPFAIIDVPGDQAIGSTRYAAFAPEHRRVEIGWTWIVPEFQRTHVNTECKLLLLQHAFETLGCNRVEFKTDILNTQSRSALLRIGAVEEGVFRSHMVMPDGRVRDSVYFSVVRDDWPALKRRLSSRPGGAP